MASKGLTVRGATNMKPILQFLKGVKVAHDFASTTTGNMAITTVNVPGAALGDLAYATSTTALPAFGFLSAEVTAADTVTIKLCALGGTVDPGAANYSVFVLKEDRP